MKEKLAVNIEFMNRKHKEVDELEKKRKIKNIKTGFFTKEKLKRLL